MFTNIRSLDGNIIYKSEQEFGRALVTNLVGEEFAVRVWYTHPLGRAICLLQMAFVTTNGRDSSVFSSKIGSYEKLGKLFFLLFFVQIVGFASSGSVDMAAKNVQAANKNANQKQDDLNKAFEGEDDEEINKAEQAFETARQLQTSALEQLTREMATGTTGSTDSGPAGAAAKGDGSTSPGTTKGDGSTSPGTTKGDGSTSPGTAKGDGSFSPGIAKGDGSFSPGTAKGDGSTSPGTAKGDGSFSSGTAKGDGSFSPGTAKGDGSFSPGTAKGDGSTSPGIAIGSETTATPYNIQNPDGSMTSNGVRTQTPDGRIVDQFSDGTRVVQDSPNGNTWTQSGGQNPGTWNGNGFDSTFAPTQSGSQIAQTPFRNLQHGGASPGYAGSYLRDSAGNTYPYYGGNYYRTAPGSSSLFQWTPTSGVSFEGSPSIPRRR